MLFNSVDFLLFFPLICILFWVANYAIYNKNIAVRVTNILLLVGSYYFYMCWKPEYALLLLYSTVVTYLGGLAISKSKDVGRKKLYVTLIIVLNIGILAMFKYLDFFAESISALFEAVHLGMHIEGLHLLLPVGISFYIFQSIGYTIDVYRGDVEAERNFFTYALFVSFFPQLVAGPIERSSNLLRQFKKSPAFDYDFAISGFRLMLWGYFMKLCLADRAAVYVNEVFNSIGSHDGYSTLVASVLFSLQIYGDFAGYTFIAIGAARIMGFSLNDNFRRPYFSFSISDFWRRWHISLSSWLRDYVYIPLGGSRVKKSKIYRNLMITFGISGLWHGANWTFVVWGLMHGTYLCIERMIGWNKKHWHSIVKVLHIILTFCLVCLAFVVFRANDIGDAVTAIRQMFDPAYNIMSTGMFTLLLTAIATVIVFIKELCEENGWLKDNAIVHSNAVSSYIWPIFLIVMIGIFGKFEGTEFIYFQF